MDLAGETKGETRRRLRAHRRQLVASRDLGADAEAIAAVVAGATALRGSGPGARPRGAWDPAPQDTAFAPGTVLSYESLPHEPPTTALNSALQGAGHRVLVPITLPGWRLEWCDLADPERSPLGIASPATADVVVVPALAVDTRGTRLGQGGGCYDRVLPMLQAGTPVLVLLHPGEHTSEPLPRDPHDVPVTTVVTAAGITGASAPLRA